MGELLKVTVLNNSVHEYMIPQGSIVAKIFIYAEWINDFEACSFYYSLQSGGGGGVKFKHFQNKINVLTNV